jgi:hypothetical protein
MKKIYLIGTCLPNGTDIYWDHQNFFEMGNIATIFIKKHHALHVLEALQKDNDNYIIKLYEWFSHSQTENL